MELFIIITIIAAVDHHRICTCLPQHSTRTHSHTFIHRYALTLTHMHLYIGTHSHTRTFIHGHALTHTHIYRQARTHTNNLYTHTLTFTFHQWQRCALRETMRSCGGGGDCQCSRAVAGFIRSATFSSRSHVPRVRPSVRPSVRRRYRVQYYTCRAVTLSLYLRIPSCFFLRLRLFRIEYHHLFFFLFYRDDDENLTLPTNLSRTRAVCPVTATFSLSIDRRHSYRPVARVRETSE